MNQNSAGGASSAEEERIFRQLDLVRTTILQLYRDSQPSRCQVLPHDAAASMKQQFFDLDPAGLYVVFVCVCVCVCVFVYVYVCVRTCCTF
jgi:hypothetical protein